MGIEAALFTHLSTDAGVIALASTRIYPMRLPQTPTLPAVTYTRISTAPVQHRGSAAPTFSRPRFQLDCWDDDYDGARALRTAVVAAMATLAQGSNPRIEVALLQDDRDIAETESGRWRATLDYFIWHEE